MIRIAAALLATAALATPALADRGPSRQEAQAIAASLTSQGFTSWKRLKFDGRIWRVEDARSVRGGTHDLDLSPADYGIVKEH